MPQCFCGVRVLCSLTDKNNPKRPVLCLPFCAVLSCCQVSPTDVEEGMRVGVDRTKYSVQIPLPPKIDPTVRGEQVFKYFHRGGVRLTR